MTNTFRKPNFFIVGAPKCATSSMEYYLRQHPDVFLVPDLEPWHFMGGLPTSACWAVRDEREYERLFASVRDEKIVGEKTVVYLFSAGTPQEIHEYNPDSRILVILRHPADVMYSWHRQLLHTGGEDIYDFEEALAAETDRRQGRRIPKSAYLPAALQYREVVRFADQIRRYYDAFGRQRVKVLLLDDVKADLAGCYRDVLRFLEVDDAFTPDFTARNVTGAKRMRHLNIRRLMRRSPLVFSAVRVLPRPIAKVLSNGLALVNRGHRVDPHERISAELRDRLTREMEPEIHDLAGVIDCDLSKWLGTEAAAP